MPCHPVYQTLDTPRHTRSNLRPSGSSDQLADQAINLQIKPITAAGSVQPRSNGSKPSATLVYDARIHTVAQSQSLSVLSPSIFSLSSDLPFPAVWRIRTTTERERFLPTYKAKPRPVSAFSPPYLAEKRLQFLSATRSFKPTILPHQPSTAVETTFIKILSIRSTRSNHFWPEISLENFTASNSNRAWATRATRGIFINFQEIQGYFSILPIQWHSGNFLGFLMVFLIFLYIYKCL